MSFKTVTFPILLAVAVVGALRQHAPGALRALLPDSGNSPHGKAKGKEILGSYIGHSIKAEEWADPEALSQKLFAALDSRLGGQASPDKVREFLKEPENRLLLEQQTLVLAELAAADKHAKEEESYRKTVDDLRRQIENSTKYAGNASELPEKVSHKVEQLQRRIDAIENELTAKHSVSALVQGGNSSGKKGALPTSADFVEHLTNNLDWLAQINSSGELPDVGNALAIMERIYRNNPDILYNQVERDIATATAVEFAISGWAQEDAVTRALYYSKNMKAGKLNSVFNDLPLWQRRLVCGLKGKGTALGAGGNDKAGNIESMEYSLNNVHLPAYRYCGSCWQAPYRLHNIYGEIVHSGTYHEPFNDVYGGNFNELTRTAGGVCGGLSHYGATTATANGVPALTAGEPGHCSYIVLVGDTWTPAYSLSWQRGLHWQVFRGNNKYSALHMASKLFSPEEKERTSLSQAMRSLGNAYAAAGRPAEAKSYHAAAAAAQPLNYYAWRDYAKHLADNPQTTAGDWKDYCRALHTTMAPGHPEMAAEILKAHVYPSLKKALGNDKAELQRVLTEFWKNVNTMGPDAEWDKSFHGRWDVEGLCQAQLGLLGINPQKDAALKDYYRLLMGALAGKADYVPVALSWGNSLLDKMDASLQGDFMAAMLGGVNPSANAANETEHENLLKPVILAAERTGDIRSFQSIGQSLPEKFRNPDNKVNPPNDFATYALVSRGGVLQASSTSGFDNPCAHWGVLEPGVGGAFHTAKDTDAWVKVTLPKQANITGIIIQTTTGNLWRLNNMKVQVSETGADNDWKDVASLGACNQQTIKVDLRATAPLAKYVRIVRTGGPEFFHLRGIFVYGTPAA